MSVMEDHFVLHDVVERASESCCVRRWCEAELAAVVSPAVADAATMALSELLIAACGAGPVDVRVAITDSIVRIDVRCSGREPAELSELAHLMLADAVERWGVAVRAGSACYWAEIDRL